MRQFLDYKFGFFALLVALVIGLITIVHHNHEEWQRQQIDELRAVVSQQNAIQQQIIQYLNAHPIK